jgi:hypothetical protein
MCSVNLQLLDLGMNAWRNGVLDEPDVVNANAAHFLSEVVATLGLILNEP